MTKSLFIALMAVATLGLARPAQAEDFAGHYDIRRGVNPDGTTYSGHVTVRETGEDVHYLTWKLPGGLEYHGVGLLTDGILGVGWSSGFDHAIIVYKVEGGQLKGDWVDERSEFEYGYEELKGPPGLDGIYDIVEGFSPDLGDKYTGTVDIRPNGDVYFLTWHVGGTATTGVGLLVDDMLIVGCGERAGIVYYEHEGSDLIGHWAYQEDKRQGSEDLVRIEGDH